MTRSSINRNRRRKSGVPSFALDLANAQPLVPPAESARVVLAKPMTHPNVFRKRIQHMDGNPKSGDWVCLYHTDNEGGIPELFAHGLYNSKSEIAVRIVRWSAEPPDAAFWEALIDRAASLRTETLQLDGIASCYRVLHAEADGTPGLVVDRYGDCLSAEVFSIAMATRTEALLARLAERLGTKHWLIQPSPHLLSQEGYEFRARASEGLPPQTVVEEFGVKYKVHFGTGHKTGFFCDQRENRRKLADFCPGKSVLDVCCYSGGFSVMAATLGQAAEITGVDLDASPLEIAKHNAAINNVRVKFTQADAFGYMRDMIRGGREFDVVVLDPPKLIRNRSEIEEGTRKHFDLNRLAMQLVRPGGIMLTCSCAGLLPDHEFTRLVRAAARSAFRVSELRPQPEERQMQILARSGAAACHPVSANCPETEYLKAMWLRL
jgi:23S rRNA (cytosine1962-C5)-methyltransferase